MRRHCACLHDDALDCARERYGDDTDEPCDCVCHDEPEDDDLEARPGARAPAGALTAAGEGERGHG
jgi:hypothetical protein